MSDPVTNAEVEDVLSSIRRLVSEEKRPKQPAQSQDAADRLVLTPALRVEDEETVEKNESIPQADPQNTYQDTVGETAKQLFDPSDDMPSDVYNRRIGADFGWSGEDEALFDDLVANENGEEATSSADPSKMPMFRHDDHADDYSEDPYGFSDDEEETGEADDVSAHPPATVSEDPPHVAEGDLDAAEEEAEADDDTFEAEAEAEGEAEPEEEASGENDMFDFDMLAKRGQEAAARDQDLHAPEAPQSSADAPDEDRQAGMVAASKAATLSAKIAALETAIGNIADTWEPDTPGTDDYSGTDQPAMAWEDDVSHDATGLPLRSEAAQAAWQEAHPDVVMIGTARAAAAAAAQEERAAEMRSEGEAREARTRDIAAEDQAARDRAIAAARAAAAERVAADKRAAEQREEARAQAEADARTAVTARQTPIEHTAAETSSTAEDGLDDVDDSQLLDEEALRDIVSEIVRAELQGALGERITRNVRKLVRREIHRALTAQELE